MKEINGYLFLEVPEGTNKFKMGGECPDCLRAGIWHCAYADTCGNNFPAIKAHKEDSFKKSIILPKGNYSIIGLAKDLTEEQWKGIVDVVKDWSSVIYHNYDAGGRDYRDVVDNAFYTAKESGHSLLKANNLNPDNCLILKNENR